MADALGFKKSKGRRNIRQRGGGSGAGLDETEAAEIVKRTVRAPAAGAAGRVEYVSGRTAAGADTAADAAADSKAMAVDSESVSEALHPFGGGSEFPSAQDVYAARRQRQQQQAVLAAGVDDDDEEDYVALSVGASDAASDAELGGDSPLLVGREERALGNLAARRTKAQQVQEAQSDDESSDWERAQLQSAGVALDSVARDGQKRRNRWADDGWQFDARFMRLVVDEEERMLGEELERLRVAEAGLKSAVAAVERADAGIAQAQQQLEHFTALGKSLQTK
ncbi:hypothetical protein LPJ73_001869 [Coemansia sp. RSA 2703]|nr:hypothetical protein LPJ73_001869 [Coemansia sp. RSA 2703]